MSNEESSRDFVRAKLPWIAGGGALALFLLTLNHWVNLRSLPVIARITGWEWTLPTQWPLFYAVTYPFRFFPPALQPVALNVFSAFCAALTLALLARSVALLPHDRTHEQRLRERSEFSLLSIRLAWVPVLLAVFACGLQLTFWEHATAMTGEMLDLLFFAFLIRCLLEYRVSREERWLSKLALAYGLSVTNNWAMIGFFPGFLAAVIWIKGLRFFDPAFLVRMSVLGVAGLLLYLLLPAVWMFYGDGEASFFKILRANWAAQKMYLVDTPVLRNRALLVGLTSVLPVALMGIRWPSSFGDTSVAGASLTNLAFRVIHLFFLGACLWVVFDPKYSPRALGLGLTFLSFYYLGALAIGYYSGYALLVFTAPPHKTWRRGNALGKLFNPVVQAAVLIALAAVPTGLIYKNHATIAANNGEILREFISRTAESLPPGPAYLLSEDSYQLSLLRAHMDARNPKNEYVYVNTRSLELPAYHEQLHKRYGERWPLIAPKEELGIRVARPDIQHIIRSFASTNRVVYLHPSFGYFFETLYARPAAQTYVLEPFAADQVLPPPLTADELQKSQAFWAQSADHLAKVERLRKLESLDAQFVALFYSRALNTWGVDLQRSEKIIEAGKEFSLAARLNTNNVPARMNRDFNHLLQLGAASEQTPAQSPDEMLGHYRTWDAMLSDNGPFDTPFFCGILGNIFLSQAQYRQAALQFSRVVHFQPTNFTARSGLARAYIYGRWLERGLKELDQIERDFADLPVTNRLTLMSLRSVAYFNDNDFPKAESILLEARAKYPEAAAESLFELYRVAGKYTNALAILDEQLQKNPTNIVVLLQKAELQINNEQYRPAQQTLDQVLAVAPKNLQALLYQAFASIQQKQFQQALPSLERALQEDSKNIQALLYKGIVHMELKQYDKARDVFDDLLAIEPDHIMALRNRAILNLRAQLWIEAKEDYERLRKILPRSHAVMYGLGEVAYNLKNYSDAAKYYEAYLKYVPAEGGPELAAEKEKVQQRLREAQTAQK